MMHPLFLFAALVLGTNSQTIEIGEDGGTKKVVDGTTLVEYAAAGGDLSATTGGEEETTGGKAGVTIMTIAYTSTTVECGPIGGNSTVTIGFSAYGSGGVPVIKDLELIYDWGETSYVVKVDDSEAPAVGANQTSAEVYTAVETYIYQNSGIFDTKFGWKFSIVDETGSLPGPFPLSSNILQLAQMLMEEDECEYNYKTSEPTMVPLTPSPSSPTTSTSSALKMGSGHHFTLTLFLASIGFIAVQW